MVIFEGEYLDGKRWKGIIKEYNHKDKLVFEGDLINGKKNGIGKIYEMDRLIYEGEFLNGKRHGKGKEYYDTEEIYRLLINLK